MWATSVLLIIFYFPQGKEEKTVALEKEKINEVLQMTPLEDELHFCDGFEYDSWKRIDPPNTRVREFTVLGQHIYIAEDERGSELTNTIAAEFDKDIYNLFIVDVRDGDKIIDIGGNIGFFGLVVGNLFPKSTIYSFEPMRYNYERYAWSICANKLSNVVVYHSAVTGDGRNLKVTYNIVNPGGSSAFFQTSCRISSCGRSEIGDTRGDFQGFEGETCSNLENRL